MRRRTLLSSMCALGLLACTDSATEPDPVVESINLARGGNTYMEAITGSGHFVTGPFAYTPDVWRTFTITAKKAQDGSVDGKYSGEIG